MNDLRFIFRILTRNPLTFFVNVTGLGVALTMVILTITYLRFELSYDNHLPTGDRVVRLYERVTDNTSVNVYGITLRDAYTQVPAMVPEVECAVQLYGGWLTSVRHRETKMGDVRIFYADNEFFRVFGKTLRSGNASTALVGTGTAVVTTSLAKKLFHSADCVGRSIESDGEEVMITGVVDDFPKNSHLDFDILVSLSTLHPENFGGLEFQTYFLLKPNVDQKRAGDKIAAANNLLMKNWAANSNAKVQSGVEHIARLYLSSAASSFIPNHGSPRQMWVVAVIALFVLTTALLSYINLFIIQGEKRILEISTRNMFGASKFSIARLFFLETAIVFSIAAILAVLATIYSMPYISQLLLSKVDLADLFSGWGILLVLLVLFVLLAITAGYPTLYLSRMKYALGLRGKLSHTGNNNLFSNISVFVQFAVTAFFISCIVIILSQLKYMRNIPLGFEKDHVSLISNCSNAISQKYTSIRSELMQLLFVTAVSGGEHTMGGGCSGQYIRNTKDSENNNRNINEYREMPGFGELMQLQLVDGRLFRESMADSHAIVVNEAATRLLGIKPEAGQTVVYKDNRVEIIGVVKDFYYQSNPGEPIEPLVIANCHWGTPNIYIRTKDQLTRNQLMQVKSVFESFDKNYVFEYKSVGDLIDRMYRKENRLAQLVAIGSAQVIVISLISLLALTILKISRRTKEIGIRKVNGSTVWGIVSGLLKDTMIMVAGAIIIASLAGYMVMDRWLSDYAARIHLTPGYFLLSALFVFVIAVVATIWQAWRAATGNPVEALKYE
jgi:putative ABC transport system permease protein